MDRYYVKEGKIPTRALEVHIVDHCNLRCDHCCSFSPILKKWEVDPEDVRRDLAEIKKYLQPSFLKIVGGEPTLHSRFREILEVAKGSEVSPVVSLTTNGNFFDRVTDDCLKLLDWVTVSVYPTKNYTNKDLKDFAKRAKQFDVTENWKVQDKFVNMNREKLSCYDEAKETFQGCWIHHRCHSIRLGSFYCCTRTQYLKALSSNDEFGVDGIELRQEDETVVLGQIKDYLNRSEPLKTCYLCKGGQAELSTQVQLTPSEKKEERERVLRQCEEINLSK